MSVEAPFTPELLTFLSELEANNNREWFQANKARYERVARDPALRFIAAFAPALAEISPHFDANPKPAGGSLFRIYRDTRFSADKTPYKTHIGMHFRHSVGADVHAPGFYLHLQPGDCVAGVGIWEPDNTVLARLRDGIVAQSAAWGALKADLEARGYQWMGESLSRPPRGYDKEHPHVEDLKRKSFAVKRIFSDAAVCEADFLDQFADVCADAAPLAAFVCAALDLPF